MRHSKTIWGGLVLGLTTLLSVSLVGASDESDLAALLKRIEQLERQQAADSSALAERDREIAALKAEVARLRGEDIDEGDDSAQATSKQEPAYFGQFQPGGRGFKVADTEFGDLNISFYTFGRYLNQRGLDETYTDAFGRTRTLDIRNDIQLQKAVIYFKGWVGDPKLRYLGYVWSANTSQGLPAQVVVAGNLTYTFSDSLTLGVGISGLPSTRSTEGNFPNWLRVDNRTIADEFFRGSYTSGLFAFGKIGDTLKYNVMLGNNLSQLGVDAGQLDSTLDTWSGELIWSPMGPYDNGFGDYERTENVATRFALHYTHSTESSQNQPGEEDPENSQIRLSDGTGLFAVDAFGTGGSITEARYRMAAFDTGIKYRGLSLEAEFYYRWVDEFVTTGPVPVSDLADHGFQLQASAMLIPKTLQLYLSGSKINGEYGDPWDAALGLNYFPMKSRQFRINGELLFIEDSPVGNFSVPYSVGANGSIAYVSAELRF